MTARPPGPRLHDRSGERGAVVVLASMLMLVLLVVAAIVIDLASLRLDRRDSRAAADFAVLAAAGSLLADSDNGAVEACNEAWAALLANLSTATPVVTAPACSNLSGACAPTTPARTVPASAGPYAITITHPVPDANALMTGTGGLAQPVHATIDGGRCERIAVDVVRQRQLTFARVIGVESGSTTVHAVARAVQDGAQQRVVALVLLERTGCDALRTDGQAAVVVAESLPLNGVVSPGSIIVDSDGTSCLAGHTLNAAGGNSSITAEATTAGVPGEITLRALASGATTCSTPACKVADVSSGKVSPQPLPSDQRIGRTPADHRYNCKPTYTLPAPWTGTVPGCSGSSPHIDQLVAANQGVAGSAPAGYATYTGPCSLASGAAPVTLTGNWYINCSPFTVRNSFTINGNAVFQGTVDVTSSGHLTMGNGATPRVAYLRSGSLTKSGQASVTLDGVSVYLHNGGVSLQGGAGSLVWRAPGTGDLAGLALWSESATATHALAGQANTTVYGVFFTPNAGYGASPQPFSISGSAGQHQLQAQFITYRLLVSGQGTLRLQAPPFVGIVLDPNLQARLIR